MIASTSLRAGNAPRPSAVLAWWFVWLAICGGVCASLWFTGIAGRNVLPSAISVGVVWLCAGIFLSRRLLRRLRFHYRVTLEDIARLKLRSLFLWPVMYPRLAFTLWIAEVL
jgi:hypothetical protein